ncbi:hypothetical protein CP10139811_0469 [Chlamydia ibidis]|uniref:Uncharacterized protein n=2 Tax=Chlamydia ibidis TaxID=1405396 RepID=S7KJE8_9CHLA|nr:hypothetical protein [Chlamydia ibidis]EPP34555.1 hypothetical protein CP10139811_0469 [Chlamydia ibidis]EQM62403.1 hypothetical protein H359_0847 [Chlamydia ibidis 10-1398/6]
MSGNECSDSTGTFKEESVSAYVLVTCGHASMDGTMEVEMTYEGDPAVISYLLTKAQDSLENS